MKKKSKGVEGQTLSDECGRFLMAQEVFAADGVRWVRVAYTRKNYKVKYSGKTHTIYDSENLYMTEMEWQQKSKKSL